MALNRLQIHAVFVNVSETKSNSCWLNPDFVVIELVESFTFDAVLFSHVKSNFCGWNTLFQGIFHVKSLPWLVKP
jgi:hypothetical protein